MALQYDKAMKLFQLDYQAPFGSLDTTAFATAINPANFVATDGFYVENNVLKPVNYKPFGNSLTLNTENFITFIPYSNYNSVGTATSFLLGYVITNKRVYTVELTAGNLIYTAVASYTPANPTIVGGGNYLIINAVANQSAKPTIYWTAEGWSEIWQYDPNTTTASNLTTFVGGGRLALLDNQMLNLGGFSPTDGYVPNRVSWSAPGQYGQWQPYDVGSGTGNYAAGFNDLPGTDDILTNFAAIGTVGYIFRNQGITQMNITGNGIEPFTFNHLWASELGIGSPYADSVVQYGSVAAFVTDAGIYTLGLSGLTEIGQSARDAIFKAINGSVQTVAQFSFYFTEVLQAQLIPYILGTPDLTYILGLCVNVGSDLFYGFFAISLSTGTTVQFGNLIPIGGVFKELQLSYFQPPFATALSGNLQLSRQTRSLAIVSAQSDTGPVTFYQLMLDTIKTATVTFRKEQMKFGYWPTVSKVGFLFCALIDATVNGTVSISVDGGLTFNAAFADIVITPGGLTNNGSPARDANPGLGIMGTAFTDGIQTLERPQIVIKLTNVQVAEVWAQGTLADYSVI